VESAVEVVVAVFVNVVCAVFVTVTVLVEVVLTTLVCVVVTVVEAAEEDELLEEELEEELEEVLVDPYTKVVSPKYCCVRLAPKVALTVYVPLIQFEVPPVNTVLLNAPVVAPTGSLLTATWIPFGLVTLTTALYPGIPGTGETVPVIVIWVPETAG
jgi:hypothetical protein